MLLPLEDLLEKRQRAWGIRAAHRWLKARGFLEMSSGLESASVPMILGMREAKEVTVEVITQSTLFAYRSKETMYRAATWRGERPHNRLIGVFVPSGFGENAKEALGLYDFCVEYDFT